MDINKSSGQKDEQLCSKSVAWTDSFFLTSSVIFFITAIIACFVPQLLVTRPFFFGMLASLLTHKLLGGVGEGEITDCKSAIGSIKVSGPVAVLFFSMIAIQGTFSLFEDGDILVKVEPKESLTVFRTEEAEGTPVVVKVNHDPTDNLVIQSTNDSLFDYFMKRCYLDKSPGCKKIVNFIANDRLVKPGKAIICNGSINDVKIAISSKDAGKNELDTPLAVGLSSEPSCSYQENTIYISSKDAKKSNIKLNKTGKGKGYISPFLGQIIQNSSN